MLWMIRISAHESQYRSLVGLHNRNGVHDLESTQFVVVDAGNINLGMHVSVDNTRIVANDTTIGSPID